MTKRNTKVANGCKNGGFSVHNAYARMYIYVHVCMCIQCALNGTGNRFFCTLALIALVMQEVSEFLSHFQCTRGSFIAQNCSHWIKWSPC